MSGAFPLLITDAGRDALVDAQNGDIDAIAITELGLTEQGFVMAPTLEALPGEFKRIESFAGQSVSETVIHMTGQDVSQDVYDLRGIGLFLADGTLFAVYSQVDPIMRKVSIAAFLIAFDIAFEASVSGDITFGDSSFLYPPASETVKGVAEIATQAETDAGVDDQRMLTSAKLAARLIPVLQAIADEENARVAGDDALSDAIGAEATSRIAGDDALDAVLTTLLARTITGGGLVTGGGNLSANRILSVAAATAAQAIAGSSNTVALTPAALGPIVKSLGNSGYISIPTADPSRLVVLQWGRFTAGANGSSSVTYPLAFSSPAWSVVVDGTSTTDTGISDNPPRVRSSSIGASGFQVFSAMDTSESCTFFAVGEIDNS